MIHCIYKTTLKDSEKYYIGRHSTDDINDKYMGSGKWVRSIKDKSSLSKVIISVCDNFEELCMLESEMIRKHIDDPNCMNFNENSVGFSSVNNPNRLLKGTETLRNRLSGSGNGMYGKTHSKEYKNRLSIEFSGSGNRFYGKTHTEESKCKISESRTGTKFSKDVIDKLKKRFPGTTHPMSKLTESQILEIYKLSWSGEFMQKEIGEMFGVSQSCVMKIKSGATWKKITNHPR